MRDAIGRLLDLMAVSLVQAPRPGTPGAGDEPLGEPVPWQLWHQTPATPVMERLDAFHWLLLVIMVAICFFVVTLLVYTVWRFHEGRNPVPSRTSHNTLLEVVWTVVPVLILVVIAIPSFRALYFMDRMPEQVDMTMKITGRQWYWDFEYPDQGGFQFSSYVVPDDQLPDGGRRLLEVDNRALVPVGATVQLIITGGDVIHAMAMPSLGIKRDAVPGRLNDSWMRIDRPGVYYGQCSEICGTGHGYMPLVIEAVEPDRFAAWVNEKRADAGQEPMAVATAVSPLTARAPRSDAAARKSGTQTAEAQRVQKIPATGKE